MCHTTEPVVGDTMHATTTDNQGRPGAPLSKEEVDEGETEVEEEGGAGDLDHERDDGSDVQEECEYMLRDAAAAEDEEDAGLDVMLEAFCDPSRPGEIPTGPALKTVICKVSTVYVGNADASPVGATSIELRILGGKKIKITIIRPASGGHHPRLQMLFEFHQITALRYTPADEEEDEQAVLELDVCLPPDFLWSNNDKGNAGWVKDVPDFTPNIIATTGSRWRLELVTVKGGNMMEMLRSCTRLATLLQGRYPAAAKDCGEDGLEIFKNNKLASTGSTQLPVNADPIGVLQRCCALLNAPAASFKFTCFKCAYTFTLQDVRDGAFSHWCVYRREQ